MRKKFSKFICVFTVIIVTLFSFTFSVGALSPKYTFDFPIARPDLEDFSVFLEILYTTDGGSSVRAEIVGVVAPYTFNNANASADSLKVTISKTNFVVSVPENSNLGALSWFYMKDTGQMYFLTGLNSIGQGLTQVLSIRVYGNAYVVDNHGSMSSYSNFVFNYGTDALMDDKLDSVIAILQNSNQNVIDNANQNASQIQQNQDKNTDKVLNGDSDLDSSGETGKVDGALGDIDGATNNAMGGKNEAQVKAEINNALDPDKIGLDFSKANRLSVFFDDTLSAFGSSYKSLLLLSLSLGLGAFLIGRRYG